MSLGISGPSVRPSYDQDLARVRAQATAAAEAAAKAAQGGNASIAGAGGSLFGWVDRPEGMTPATPVQLPNVSPSGVIDGAKNGLGRLWDWMTGWMRRDPQPAPPQAYPYPQPPAGYPGYPQPQPQPPAGYPGYPQPQPQPPAGYPGYPQPYPMPGPPAAPPPPPPPPPAPPAPPVGYPGYPQPQPYPQPPVGYPGYPQPQPQPPVGYPGYPQPYPAPNPQNDPTFQQLLAAREQVRKMREQIDQLLKQPAARPAPQPAPGPRPAPAPVPQPSRDDQWATRLKNMKPAELAHLGKTDKQAFFAALRPAAEAAERKYGVPAAVILAQAALETGWGAHLAAGYNLFGHKGEGPAGHNIAHTREVVNGRDVYIDAKFAKYHDFFEGVEYHGKRYHNGYYDKAVNNYKQHHDPDRFARDITGIYATDPSYGAKLIQLMNQYKLR